MLIDPFLHYSQAPRNSLMCLGTGCGRACEYLHHRGPRHAHRQLRHHPPPRHHAAGTRQHRPPPRPHRPGGEHEELVQENHGTGLTARHTTGNRDAAHEAVSRFFISHDTAVPFPKKLYLCERHPINQVNQWTSGTTDKPAKARS